MDTGEREKKKSLQDPSRTEKSSERPSGKPLEPAEINSYGGADRLQDGHPRDKVKFEVYGEEMISKQVKQSGNSGRVYLPPEWIGKHIKIIRID